MKLSGRSWPSLCCEESSGEEKSQVVHTDLSTVEKMRGGSVTKKERDIN